MMDEEKQSLESAGYRQFKVPSMEKYRDAAFQKRFRDEGGTKYFLTVWGYAPVPEHLIFEWHWMVELRTHTPQMTFEQHVGELKSTGEIAVFEQRAETFWQAMGQPYYGKETE